MAAAGDCDSVWVMNVKERLKKDEMEESRTNSDMRRFSIVQPSLKLFKPEAYTPQVISIGPYHDSSSKQYDETHNYKLKMPTLLEKELPLFKFSTLVEYIEHSETRIKNFYNRDISYSKERLSLMLALDTSFILQFLRSIHEPYRVDAGNVHREGSLRRLLPYLDPRKKIPLWYAIKNDILMLENQVPMFLLIEAFCSSATAEKPKSEAVTLLRSRSQSERHQEIGGLRRVHSSNQLENAGISVVECHEPLHLSSMLQAACLLFSPFVRYKQHYPPPLNLNNTVHILDYLYQYVTAPSPQTKESETRASRNCLPLLRKNNAENTTDNGTYENIPLATELSVAGIKFTPYLSGDLHEISFERKTSSFLLPKISIDASTEVVLRNLAAFELSLKKPKRPITRYIHLMDRLIDTDKDVAILRRHRILIGNMYSDVEVAQMWNSLSISIPVHAFDPIDKAMKEANESYKRKHWRVLLAEFQKTYFSKPWLVASVVSAGILLLLTVIQVLCLFYTCSSQSVLNSVFDG